MTTSTARQAPFHTAFGWEVDKTGDVNKKRGSCQLTSLGEDAQGDGFYPTDLCKTSVSASWGQGLLGDKKQVQIADESADPNLKIRLTRDEAGQSSLQVEKSLEQDKNVVEVPLGNLGNADAYLFQDSAFNNNGAPIGHVDVKLKGNQGTILLNHGEAGRLVLKDGRLNFFEE